MGTVTHIDVGRVRREVRHREQARRRRQQLIRFVQAVTNLGYDGGDWEASDVLVAAMELERYGEVEAPGPKEAQVLQQSALEPATAHGDGRRWYVTRARGEMVGMKTAPADTGAK